MLQTSYYLTNQAKAAFFLFLSLSVALPVLAQQQPQDPQGDPSTANAVPQPQVNKENTGQPSSAKAGKSESRLLFALPNFSTVQGAQELPPLTAGQKYKLVFRSAFDYVEIPWYASLAGISQAENSEPGYGQGGKGYARRFGAAFADGTIENFMTSAVLPSILHQDPRFYQTSSGSFKHRLGYAVSRIVVTRSDSGAAQINYSEILGSAMAASISTYAYHPKDDRTVSNTASVWVSEMGYDALTYVLKEFWPDVRRKIIHRAQTQSTASN